MRPSDLIRSSTEDLALDTLVFTAAYEATVGAIDPEAPPVPAILAWY